MTEFPSLAELCQANKKLDVVTAENFNRRLIVTLTNGFRISYPNPLDGSEKKSLTYDKLPNHVRRQSPLPPRRRTFRPFPLWRGCSCQGIHPPVVYVQALTERNARFRIAKRLNVSPDRPEVLGI